MPILRKKAGASDYGLALAKRAQTVAAGTEALAKTTAAAGNGAAAAEGRAALAEIQPTALTRSPPAHDRWLSPADGIPGEETASETHAENRLRRSPRPSKESPARAESGRKDAVDTTIAAAVAKGLSNENFDLSDNLRRGDNRRVDPALAVIEGIMSERGCDFDNARLIYNQRKMVEAGIHPETGLPLPETLGAKDWGELAGSASGRRKPASNGSPQTLGPSASGHLTLTPAVAGDAAASGAEETARSAVAGTLKSTPKARAAVKSAPRQEMGQMRTGGIAVDC